MATTGLAHAITRRDPIPAARYYVEDFFRLETEQFWPHVRQMAARLDQIPELGHWTEYRIFDKSGVKAFHNACRHCGVRRGKGYLTAVAAEKFATANRQLGGNFDGKILEFCF